MSAEFKVNLRRYVNKVQVFVFPAGGDEKIATISESTLQYPSKTTALLGLQSMDNATTILHYALNDLLIRQLQNQMEQFNINNIMLCCNLSSQDQITNEHLQQLSQDIAREILNPHSSS